MAKAAHRLMRWEISRERKTASIINLSANGSSMIPSWVTCLLRRARYPSITSVKPARSSTPNAQ